MPSKLLGMFLGKRAGVLGVAALALMASAGPSKSEEARFCGSFGDLSILAQGATVRLDRQTNCPLKVGSGLSLLDTDGALVGRMRVYCQAYGYIQATVTFADQGRRILGPLKVMREARDWSAEEPIGIGRVTAYEGGFTPEGSDTWCRSVANVEIGRQVSQKSFFGPAARKPFTPPPGQCPAWFSMEGDHLANGEQHLCPAYIPFPEKWSAEYQTDDFAPWYPERPTPETFVPMPYNGRPPLDLESEDSYLDIPGYNTPKPQGFDPCGSPCNE